MSGKTNLNGVRDKTLASLYTKQCKFQASITNKAVPTDSLEWYSYHIQAMVEELGEIMKADKRWKTHRNERYDRDEKLDEIADAFITLMNISIFSGFSAKELYDEIDNKINQNIERLKKAKGENK